MFLAWLEKIQLQDTLLLLIELHLERLDLVHVTRALQWHFDEEDDDDDDEPPPCKPRSPRGGSVGNPPKMAMSYPQCQ